MSAATGRVRWHIVHELQVPSTEALALCVCERGHEQVVAIDVRPPPTCMQCDKPRKNFRGRGPDKRPRKNARKALDL